MRKYVFNFFLVEMNIKRNLYQMSFIIIYKLELRSCFPNEQQNLHARFVVCHLAQLLNADMFETYKVVNMKTVQKNFKSDTNLFFNNYPINFGLLTYTHLCTEEKWLCST